MVIETISSFVLSFKKRNISRELVEIVQKTLLDSFGCMIGGSSSLSAKVIYTYLGVEKKNAIASAAKIGEDNAMLVNAVLIHALDYDDVHPTLHVHPSAISLPIALAVCERKQLRGTEFTKAYLVCSQVLCSLASGLRRISAGWNPSTLLGVFAATAAAGYLLDLSAEQLCNALGIAGGFASGFKANYGSMAKDMALGFAVSNGYKAAKLAQAGCTGAHDFFENVNGFTATIDSAFDSAEVERHLNGTLDIISPGFSLKPYAACKGVIPVIKAFEELRNQHDFSIGVVEKIQCYVSASVFQANKYSIPSTFQQRKFSIPFCAALGLSQDAITADDFNTDKPLSKEVMDLMKMVEVSEMDFSSSSTDPYAVQANVYLNDNRCYSVFINGVHGDPTDALTETEIKSKLKHCCQMSEVRYQDEIASVILNIPYMSNIEKAVNALSNLTSEHFS